MKDFRNGGLTALALALGNAAFERCIERVKTRLCMAFVSSLLFLIFSLIGVALLFVIAFLALIKVYDPTVAALILFGVCVFICAGTLIVHNLSLASLKRKKLYDRAVNEETRKDTEKLPPELFVGAEAGRFVRDFFGNNLPATLVTSLLIGAAVGYMPKTSFKIISGLAGLKRKPRR
jgi:hypothetical protein